MQTTLAQAIHNYLTVIKLEGKSPSTMRWHTKKLGGLLNFLQDGTGEPILVQELSIDAARGFIQSLMDRKPGTPIIRSIRSERAAWHPTPSTASPVR
jgi:hypothetical protein